MKRLLRIAVLCGLAFSHPFVANAQPTYFAQLPRTDGIATDPAGNIFVVADATTAKVLVVLDANGNLIGQLPMPNTSFTDIETNNLVFDPVIPTLWVLKSNGDVYLLNLSTGEWIPILSARALPVDVQGVYDVATGTIGPMDGVIPGQATYGDFTVLWRGNVLDLLVSGLSVIHPFTMRIRFVQGTFQSAKVLVSTRAPSAPPPGTGGGNLPRGVASSADGTVITTMPISGSGEFVYLFNVDFPEAGAGLPAPVLGGSSSSGMTWHPDGTFYIAGQNAICGGDPSSLLLIRPAGAICLPGGQLFSSDYDVAVSTVVPVAYTTRPDGVWAWSQ